MSASLGWLASLFVSGFTSATLLPGNSEAVWLAYLASVGSALAQVWPALLVVTLGNTLGSLLTVWLAGRVPAPKKPLTRLARFGPWTLLLAWAPVVGDALCVAAGWLRWPWRLIVPLVAAGKLVRYLVIWWGVHALA